MGDTRRLSRSVHGCGRSDQLSSGLEHDTAPARFRVQSDSNPIKSETLDDALHQCQVHAAYDAPVRLSECVERAVAQRDQLTIAPRFESDGFQLRVQALHQAPLRRAPAQVAAGVDPETGPEAASSLWKRKWLVRGTVWVTGADQYLRSQLVVARREGDLYFVRRAAVDLCWPAGTRPRAPRRAPVLDSEQANVDEPIQVICRQRSRDLHGFSSLVAIHSLRARGDVAIESSTNWIIERRDRADIIERPGVHASF